jgi:hypothetical protein
MVIRIGEGVTLVAAETSKLVVIIKLFPPSVTVPLISKVSVVRSPPRVRVPSFMVSFAKEPEVGTALLVTGQLVRPVGIVTSSPGPGTLAGFQFAFVSQSVGSPESPPTHI